MNRFKYNYKVYNGKALKGIIENSKVYFLAFLFVGGVIIGAISCSNESEISNKIAETIKTFIFSKNNNSFFDITIDSFISNIMLIIINIFLAFSLIGYPFLVWLPCIKGIGLGAFAGYLYSAYKLSGLGYWILTVFPGAIVSSVALIIACNDSCDYSKNAFMKSLRGRGQFEKDETKIFLVRQLILIGICVISSFIDSVFTFAFSGFFEI
ncbi:MAG: stage II sporulation protein M [Acutalibacteraceae bacterium]|nr:stage II sporulation protein M [Acutalibacteraceae bacterium]